VLLYPVYALLFADAGLSTGQISTLFAIWSIVAFTFEVPSGALADAWSGRRLYAAGEFLTAAGFALWLIWPVFPGFALGFVLWGLGGALSSGTLEALVYDELQAAGRQSEYARLTGRSGTVAILAMLAATLLAAPAYAAGGYLLVGIASIATVTLGGLLALGLPENRGTGAEVPESSDGSYLTLLRSGLRESVRSRRVVLAVLSAALLPGFSAVDEYLPLLARDRGAPTAAVPLLFALTAVAMAAGSAFAGATPPGGSPGNGPTGNGPTGNGPPGNGPPGDGPPGDGPTGNGEEPASGRRLGRIRHRLLAVTGRAATLPVAVTGAATLMAGGALIPHLAGMIAVAAAFGLLQFAMVRAETRLQAHITGPARSTVLSVSGFGAEVFAVALYAWFAVGLPLPVLVAACAAPLLLTALLASRSR
jgi:MFS family permease